MFHIETGKKLFVSVFLLKIPFRAKEVFSNEISSRFEVLFLCIALNLAGLFEFFSFCLCQQTKRYGVHGSHTICTLCRDKCAPVKRAHFTHTYAPHPGFRSLRICADLQGSAKIVALDLEDPYRSARSLQKCADFL